MSATAVARRLPTAPGPRGADKLRTVAGFSRSPLRALTEVTDRHGPVAELHIVNYRFCFVRDHEAARHVLVTNQDNYRKSPEYRVLAMVLGRGLLTNEGESWRHQRRLVQPMFAKRHLDHFAVHMTGAAEATLDRWDHELPDGARVDAAEAMNAITLDVVGRALFGANLTGETASSVGQAMTRVLREGIASIGSVAVRALSEIPGISGERALRIRRMRPGRRRTLAAIEELDAVVTRMVDERAAEPDTEHDDLLGLLLEARDEETGETMSRRQVRDEVMTFMAAGHETTANALAWTWMLLSQHPAARERMLAEIDEALGGRVPTSEDVDRLPWTMAVVSESMRLYPPVWGIGRQAIADDEVGGHRVRRGTVVGIVPYLIHRDPELWPNPEGFDPERFMPGAPERPKLAYMPFGAGRRICVGAGFAQMEAVLLVAMIAQRFTLDLQPAFHAVPEATITLRPRDGMPMTVRRR